MASLRNLLATFILTIAVADLVSAVLWEDLRITYSLNFFSNYGFNKIERTKTKVTNNMNWAPLFSGGGECENKQGDFEFFGYPMTDKRDKSVVTLYDKNGVIAGIQAYFPQNEVINPKGNYRFDRTGMLQNMTLNNKTYFVATAYFIQPDLICSEGRNETDLSKDGTGTGLWFQNGATPSDLITVPLKRGDAIRESWNQNACFPGMGYHNFYNVSHLRETNCAESRPAFLLYNRAKNLHGFGFVIPGLAQSPKFEHPPNFGIKRILGAENTPECILEQNTLVGSTSIHVYFISRPLYIFCPLW